MKEITLCYDKASEKKIIRGELYMKKKFLSITLVVAMAVFMLIGCGSSEGVTNTTEDIEEKDSVIVAMGIN